MKTGKNGPERRKKLNSQGCRSQVQDITALQTANLQEPRETLLETTRDLLARNDSGTLRLTLNSQRPAGLVDLFGSLNEEDQRRALALLAKPLAAAMPATADSQTLRSLATGQLRRRGGAWGQVVPGPVLQRVCGRMGDLPNPELSAQITVPAGITAPLGTRTMPSRMK